MSDNLTSEKTEVLILEPGIIENIVKPGAIIETEDIRLLKEKNERLSKGKKYAVLVTSGHLSSITKEARELVASKEFAQNTMAKALLIESLGHRIVGNFYLRINKPHIKTRLFADRDVAILWLKSVVNEQNQS
ncbi:MAG: hypothetical protein JST26_13165 [Bacteroidetes bacterium]|nr:hypothetical protein [Bacteroidota bacterium]